MNRHIPVAFLETVVFADVMKVVPADDDSPLHLHLLYESSENAASDRHVTSERTLLVNVSAFNRLKCNKKKRIFSSNISVIHVY